VIVESTRSRWVTNACRSADVPSTPRSVQGCDSVACLIPGTDTTKAVSPLSPLLMYFDDSPPYTSSIPAPSYSREPNADEERLAFSVCTNRRSLPTGQFRKTSRRITLALHEQHRKVKIPVYEHNSLITGTIGLEDCDRVRSVVLKVRRNIVRSAIGHHSRTLLAVRVSDRVASGRGELPSHQYPL
jgi:hypothetical protein